MQEQARSRKRTPAVKLEVKEEGAWTIGGGEDPPPEINYTDELIPDFTKVPEEILKNELMRNGFKTCQVKKGTMYQLLGEIWNYRKTGGVPGDYAAE